MERKKKKESPRISARQRRRDRIYDVESLSLSLLSRSGELVSPSNKRREIFSHSKWHEYTNIYFVRIRGEGTYTYIIKKMDVLSLDPRGPDRSYICGIHAHEAAHGELFFSNFMVEHLR